MSIFAKAKKARENKKGFTLVELIVVLVILAILAAMMVPALLGWIDEARNKQYVLEARSVYMAAQAVADELYSGQNDKLTLDSLNKGDGLEKIKKLSDVELSEDWLQACTVVDYKDTAKNTANAFKIKAMYFSFSSNSKDVYAKLDKGSWTVDFVAPDDTSLSDGEAIS